MSLKAGRENTRRGSGTQHLPDSHRNWTDATATPETWFQRCYQGLQEDVSLVQRSAVRQRSPDPCQGWGGLTKCATSDLTLELKELPVVQEIYQLDSFNSRLKSLKSEKKRRQNQPMEELQSKSFCCCTATEFDTSVVWSVLLKQTNWILVQERKCAVQQRHMEQFAATAKGSRPCDWIVPSTILDLDINKQLIKE